MPNINQKSPGDNFYPQYNVSKPEPVSAITIAKGNLYTKGSGATGNQLVAVTATGFEHGIYQAAESIDVAGTAGQHRVDCYGSRTRVGLEAKSANLHAGDLVKYDITNHNVEAWTVSNNGPTKNEILGVVGRIYRIFSRTSIDVEKNVTAIGDTVIVDLGVGI